MGADNKKTHKLKAATPSSTAHSSFKEAFKKGQQVASTARKRRESEVDSLAKIKSRF